MLRLGERPVRPKVRSALGRTAAALLLATALSQAGPAQAGAHGGGGGFHGGGFHGGGFHGGGFHGSGFHGGFHGDFHGHRFGTFHGGGFGLAWPYYSYPYGWDDYPYYGYDTAQPNTSQTWYYCANPAGYYPYVAQCNTGWQAVPAS